MLLGLTPSLSTKSRRQTQPAGDFSTRKPNWSAARRAPHYLSVMLQAVWSVTGPNRPEVTGGSVFFQSRQLVKV